MSKLTLIGLYNYDNSLFQSLTFPEGIDKDIAVNEILLKSGEFEILYPNLDFLKLQITAWGVRHSRTFEKWVAVQDEEYNPLHNYDRHEEYTDRENVSKTDNNTNQIYDNSSVSSNHDVTNTNMGDVQTDVSAYDSSTFQPKEKSTNNLTNRDAGSNSTTSSGNSTQTVNGNEQTTRGLSHSAHLYGNIGIVSSQEMYEREIKVQRWNIYEAIADIFVDEFCIPIYF